MTEEEKKWFEELRKDREENARVMRKRSMNGVKKDVIEKYPDTAHFIYELLQNADDTGATKVKFMLEKDRLIFKHNGTRRFSISDPKDENNTLQLGDINSITSIGNSTKEEKQNTIGKFGVGFKSVFQYTSTPEIYDQDFCFRIEELVVPVLIDEEYNGREKDETLFVFPFNSEKMTQEEAYQDISNKLQSLSYPSMFLNNIKDIDYEFKDKKDLGMYEKRIIESKILDENTTAEFIEYTQGKTVKLNDIAKQKKLNFESIESQKEFSASGDIITERFWKFNRKIPTSNDLTCSIAFLVDEKNNQLKPIKKTAFCFFPTREDTKLNFLINAPFLLNNSRANIVAKEKHNKNMIEILSKLAGDSLVYLRDIGEEKGIKYIDDNILNIVPKERGAFFTYYDEISFAPFYDRIKEKFETEKLLPTKNGYVTKENAYWSDSKMIKELFSNEQIGTIFGNSAEWVFFDRNDNYGDCYSYIKDIVKYIADYDILNNITSGFIENQSIEWLDDFYDWIKSNKDRRDSATIKPIFLNQYKEAVSAFLQDGKLNLFLPSNDISFECNTVYLELLKCKSAKNLLKELDIREPNIQDELEVVFKKYENYEYVVPDNTFKMLFEFFEKVKIIPQNSVFYKFKNKKIFKCYSLNKNIGIANYDKGSELYFPSDDLKEYFKTKPSTKFLDIEYYKKLVKADEKKLKEFLDNFEVCNFPKVIKIYRSISYILDNYPKSYKPYSKKDFTYWEYSIDGLQEFLDSILLVDNKEKQKKSILLWNYLKIISDLVPYKNKDKDKDIKLECINNFLCISCEYLAVSNYKTWFRPSILTKQIVSTTWLLTKNNEFKMPSETYIDELSDIYEQNRIYTWNFNKLVDFLGIKKRNIISIDDEINDFTEQLGGKEKVKQILKAALERQREENRNQISSDEYVSKNIPPKTLNPYRDISDFAIETEKEVVTDNSEEPLENKPKDVESSVDKEINDELRDEIKAIKAEAEEKIEKAREEKLTKKIENSIRYSFGWFKYLLEKEKELIIGDKKSKSREISITFYKVEKETDRILILKNPNRYIPQYIEELGNIPLIFTIGEEETEDEIKKVKVEIEVSSVKNYTLRVKLKPNENIKDIEFSKIYKAEIEAKNTDFLIKELQEKFESLKLKDDYELSDDYDMQKNLCENIEFVFGPPGTGKTTYLAREVLLPKMRTEDVKILVLTPTNKSADVLTNKIIQNDKEEEYKNFLVRFGITDDENIEQNKDIFHEKFFDIENAKKNITITTMARFPYDYFMIENRKTINLRDIEWDYIVIDEASMIPLAYIVYVLYKAKPKQFIIAGDPFQIDPIVQCKEWKDENIYDLVNLRSFKDTKTVPHEYKVNQLPIQYRSIPSIGNIFSHFAYGGILEHKREESDQLKLNIEDKINIKSLNIIKYPVSKYESIYRAKRLRYSSPYQIYSALFSFEFTQYLANIISERNPNENIKIGVISPYKAQILLVDKLLASSDIPQNISIQAGTIHGFQGDECNIIIALLNNPPLNSSNKKISLNKQNIINVAISRARDYLFVIMPDDDTENIDDLEFVKNLETLIKKNEYIEYSSKEVEKLMFGSETYLEDNAFSTSHQNVNVYNLPEKCYEIRSEDYSIDIQVHKEN